MIEEIKIFPSILAFMIWEIYRHVLDIPDKEQNAKKAIEIPQIGMLYSRPVTSENHAVLSNKSQEIQHVPERTHHLLRFQALSVLSLGHLFSDIKSQDGIVYLPPHWFNCCMSLNLPLKLVFFSDLQFCRPSAGTSYLRPVCCFPSVSFLSLNLHKSYSHSLKKKKSYSRSVTISRKSFLASSLYSRSSLLSLLLAHIRFHFNRKKCSHYTFLMKIIFSQFWIEVLRDW